MTREDHANGTDRLAEAVGHFPDADVIVNVQGDEPLIAPDVIDDLCRAFEAEPDLTMLPSPRLCRKTNTTTRVPSKSSSTRRMKPCIFRAPSSVPAPLRLKKGHPAYKHIGIYAYRRDFLLQYAPWNRRRQKKSSPWNSCGFSKMVIR